MKYNIKEVESKVHATFNDARHMDAIEKKKFKNKGVEQRRIEDQNALHILNTTYNSRNKKLLKNLDASKEYAGPNKRLYASLSQGYQSVRHLLEYINIDDQIAEDQTRLDKLSQMMQIR